MKWKCLDDNYYSRDVDNEIIKQDIKSSVDMKCENHSMIIIIVIYRVYNPASRQTGITVYHPKWYDQNPSNESIARWHC